MAQTLLRLFGPVTLLVDGVPVSLGRPMQRRVLAVLALELGTVVSSATVIDRLWDGAAPAQARASLHVYIARLRVALRHTGSTLVLHRASGGYLLEANDPCVDVAEFRALGRQVEAQPPSDADLQRCGQALELRVGPALDGMQGAWPAAVRRELDEALIVMAGRWARAVVRLGCADAALPRLTGLVEEFPQVEPLVGGWIEVLAQAGRHREAIEAYLRFRRLVVASLGVEPGPDLQALYLRLLQADGVVQVTRSPAPGTVEPDRRDDRRLSDRTEDGSMPSPVSPAPVTSAVGYRVQQLRRAEWQRLVQTPPGAMMRTAAAGLAQACCRVLRERTGGVSGRRVVLLVGGGGNGTDALLAGVRLRERGVGVTALCAVPPADRAVCTELQRAGGRVLELAAAAGHSSLQAREQAALSGADLLVDGLHGLGGRPGLQGAAALLAQAARAVPAIRVAADLPSGIDPDTGELPANGAYLPAEVTVAFGAVAAGVLLPPAAGECGDVTVVDLGFADPLAGADQRPAVECLTAEHLGRLWPVPAAGDDKYRRGVLGMVVGSATYPGAAVLATSGALRAGTGMVRLIGPSLVQDEVRARWPEVVFGPGRVQAWTLGCGVPVGVSDQDGQHEQIRSALAGGEPAVLDAGAIEIAFPAGWRQDSCPHSQQRRSSWLLTPHAGELAGLLARLSGSPSPQRAEVERRPWFHATQAAERTGCCVLLKGSRTVLATPDGAVRVQAQAPSWLATAGAGDVLAGIAGALLAGGLSTPDAGAVAAAVHALAAQRVGGPLVAGDIAEQLPAVVSELCGPGILR